MPRSFGRQISRSRSWNEEFSYIKSNIRADEAVKPYLAQASDGILVMDQYLPWKKAVEKEEGIAFVVFPSNRGGYCAMSVKDSVLKETKCPFPAEWYGKRDKELAEISGIASLRFCHKTGFMLTADEKEDAILACRVSREKEKKSRIFWMRIKERSKEEEQEGRQMIYLGIIAGIFWLDYFIKRYVDKNRELMEETPF